MSTFAKLFEVDGIGQILVTQDTSDDGLPSVFVSHMPEGYGVCTFCFSFADDEAGWESCDRAFQLMDEEKAADLVRQNLLELLP